jgi:hypothetical protein
LRDHHEGSRNTFTVGNGHHPGATPGHGNSRETGRSRGRLVPAGGARCRGSRATGRSGAARPGKAPFISYMKGALLYSAGPRRSSPDRHAGKTPTCQTDHEAERARLNDVGRSRPRSLGQVGMTSIFPPTATAATVAASHSRNQTNCGRCVRALRLSPSDEFAPKTKSPRTPDNRSSQAIA